MTASTPAPVLEPAETVSDLSARRGHSPANRLQHLLHRRPALSPLAVLLIAVVIFSLVNARFYSAVNLSLVAQQSAVVGSLAVGQTLIILTAGIDLSIGAIAVLASFLAANLVFTDNVSVPLALLAAVVVAVAAQAVNGLLVTRVNLPPFIVTLGTFNVFTAITLVYAKGQTITLNSNSGLLWTGQSFLVGNFRVTYGVVLMIVLYLAVAYALRCTAWGRHLYATGDDTEAARLAGINTRRVLLSAYIVAGLVIAVSAWILCGRVGGADPNSALNANLESITAVVIGGTSLFGGRGSLLGSLLGALIVQVFDNGLALAGVDANYQVLAVGVLVILAVSVDQWIRKVKA
jgi:fructose transport system permease protein